MHKCPMVGPGGVPHEGGPVTGPGCCSVFIENMTAAVAGDGCACVGALDYIIAGSSSVFIGGKPAARIGDLCFHGGTVSSGSGTVFIGGETILINIEIKSEKFVEPSAEEKAKLIKQAIKDCIVLLERKLALMESGDPATMKAFKKWFGRDDEEAVRLILERIRRALDVSRGLTLSNFVDRSIECKNDNLFAEAYPEDKSYRIFVNQLFWKAKPMGKNSKAGIVVHELSHFKDIGNTKDYVYEKLCLRLARVCPEDAIYNADNFEYFIVCKR